MDWTFKAFITSLCITILGVVLIVAGAKRSSPGAVAGGGILVIIGISGMGVSLDS